MYDDDLAARARRGDPAAFNRLVARYQDQVYTLCLRVLGEPAAAEDATQETFLAAYEALGSYRGGAFRAWLLRIAANVCYDEHRRRRRRPTDSLDDVLEHNPAALVTPTHVIEHPERAVERRELRELLQAGLLELPIEQRTALLLHDVYGLDYQEIAQVEGVPLGTVKSRISRGRAQLRDFLRAHGELLAGAERLENG